MRIHQIAYDMYAQLHIHAQITHVHMWISYALNILCFVAFFTTIQVTTCDACITHCLYWNEE